MTSKHFLLEVISQFSEIFRTASAVVLPSSDFNLRTFLRNLSFYFSTFTAESMLRASFSLSLSVGPGEYNIRCSHIRREQLLEDSFKRITVSSFLKNCIMISWGDNDEISKEKHKILFLIQ